MSKLFEWILITGMIIAISFESVMMCNVIVIQEKMNDVIERIDAEGAVGESVMNDTLKPWCEMYYYGEKGVRVKCEARGIDTTVNQSFNVSVDNGRKELHFWSEKTITF